MSESVSVTREQVLGFMACLGYPVEDAANAFTLLLLDGVTPGLEVLGDGSRWTFEGDLSEVWSSTGEHHVRPRSEVRLVQRTSRIDEDNDLLIGLGRGTSGEAIFWGVLANMNAGSIFGDNERGWPRIADGEHHYAVGVRAEGPHTGMDCLRPLPNGNRVVRERPTGRLGGDNWLTLDEFLDQDDPAHASLGYAYNETILCHPGGVEQSAGCWGTAGGYDSVAWRGLMSGARTQVASQGAISVLVWPGEDLLRWLQAGAPDAGAGDPPRDSAWRPSIRPGASGPWVAALQRLLGVADDGLFGKGTGRALRAWRSEKGLTTSSPAVEAAEWAALEGRG